MIPPAIKLFRRVTCRYPSRPLWSEIEAAMGEPPNELFFELCFKEWSKRGYKPLNLAWLFEWYKAGRIPQGVPEKPATKRPGAYVGASAPSVKREIENQHLSMDEILAIAAEADAAKRPAFAPPLERQYTFEEIMQIVRLDDEQRK